MEHATESNAVIAHALKGIKFPASRADLVKQAKANQAEQHTIDILSHMPDDGIYQTMSDVLLNSHIGKEAANQAEAKKNRSR